VVLPVRLTVEARTDRARLAAFLAELSPHAAERAMNLIEVALRRLSAYPETGRPSMDGRRDLPIRFGASGYIVQYRVDPDAVVIARIFHMREDRSDA
jgi:plasmid stabilization system protein ParE